MSKQIEIVERKLMTCDEMMARLPIPAPFIEMLGAWSPDTIVVAFVAYWLDDTHTVLDPYPEAKRIVLARSNDRDGLLKAHKAHNDHCSQEPGHCEVGVALDRAVQALTGWAPPVFFEPHDYN